MKVKDILNGAKPLWIPSRDYHEKKPEVTIILPTYRRAKSGMFEKAVHSVINQKFKDWELIIIDDCSTDGTFDLINYFMRQDERISCIRHSKNIGLPAISTFEGYQKSRGNYFAFIFDDNEWDDGFLQNTITYMEREGLKASYGIVRSHGSNGTYYDLGTRNDTFTMLDLSWINFIGNSGIVLHRETVDTVGWYDPHILMVRLCDLDLWRRISRYYQIEPSNIFASDEWGATLDDSLGNSVSMNRMAAYEHMSLEREGSLLPQNFEEYEIDAVPQHFTDVYIETLKLMYCKYKEKFWYEFKAHYERQGSPVRGQKKRIFVIFYTLDATASLAFHRLAYNDEVLYHLVPAHRLHYPDFCMADGVILVRDLSVCKKVINICRFFKIPLWYYLDDNYLEISKDLKKDHEAKRLASYLSFKFLKQFEGVILSTKPLLDYFEKEQLHSNLSVLGPSFDPYNRCGEYQIKDKDMITFAFMGGSFRSGVLEKTVLPALEKIGENTRVRLVYPKGRLDKAIIKNSRNISFLEVEISLSLETTIYRYRKYEPDFLIHCGPELKNNRFKTKNSLVNAVGLGAVLVVSNVYPFKNEYENPEEYVSCENTIDSWYHNISDLIQNCEARKEIYRNAYEYCTKEFDPVRNTQLLNDLFRNKDNVSLMEIIMRYDEMYSDLFYGKNLFDMEVAEDLKGKPIRSNNLPLQLSTLIKDKVAYDIKCTVNNFCEIGLAFASFGECQGTARIGIWEGRSQKREIIFELEEFVRDNWTYLVFEAIPDSLNKVFTIVIEIDYAPFSALVGVYEISDMRSFAYKVANKLGKHLRGMDVLFADCRE